MNTLVDMQTDFLRSVFLSSDEATQSLHAQLQDTPALTAEQQLAIYTDSIHAGLINALADIYPLCEKLTGERFFFAMAKQYILQQPSRSPDLADFGASFANFIAHFDAADSVPYLADMGKLEWAYHSAFHAKNESLFDMQIMTQYTEQQLMNAVFLLPVSYCLIQSPYPIDDIWKLHQADNDASLQITIEERYFYVYRKQYEIHIDRLSEYEWRFLQAIQQGLPFIEVCEQLPETVDVSDLLVKSLQQAWINQLHVS